MTQRFISEEDFFATFRPKVNHLRAHASWNGCMFETYGAELDHVRKVLATDPCTVWTVLECDGALTASSGFHHVNRVGYLITEVPVAEDEMVETIDDDPLLDDDDDVEED